MLVELLQNGTINLLLHFALSTQYMQIKDCLEFIIVSELDDMLPVGLLLLSTLV